MSRIAESATNVTDRLHRRVVGDDRPRPDRGHEFVLAHQSPRIQRQVAQGLVCLRPQLDHLPLRIQQGFAAEVEYEVGERQPRRNECEFLCASIQAVLLRRNAQFILRRAPAVPSSFGRFRSFSFAFVWRSGLSRRGRQWSGYPAPEIPIMQIKHPAAFTLGFLCAGAFAAPQLIIVNANVLTADPGRPRAQAVAIEDGRFSAVGDDAQIRAMAGPATRVIDAGGRLAIPGLVEAHVHIGWGLSWAPLAMPGLPFPGPTAGHALAAVADAAREDRLFKRPFSSPEHPRRALGHAPAWLLGAAPAC